MEHQEITQSTGLGSRPLAAPAGIIRQYLAPNRKSAAGQAPCDSEKARSSLVRKADEVLQDELLGRATPSTELIPGVLNNSPVNLEPTIQLLRQQAYRLIDTFIEVLRNRPEQLAQIASQFASLEGFFNGDDFLPFPLLKVPSPVSAGKPGQIEFSLINDNSKETADYALYMTDLIGVSGHRIPATQINVSPNPSKIPPGESIDGRIEIRVPPDTPPGLYAGLLQAEDISRLQAAVQLAVGP